MAVQLTESPTQHVWRALPDHTPERSTARWLLAGVAMVSAIIAGAFSYFGAWVVAPFAGLEVAALWLALHHLTRHANDHEEIILGENSLRIISTCAGKQRTEEFHPYWAQVRFEPTSKGFAPARLSIHSHGRSIEIGQRLTASQKNALAQDLRANLAQSRNHFSQKPTQP